MTMNPNSAGADGSNKKRAWFQPKSFRTKFILVVGAAVVFDLLLSGGVALWNVSRLSRESSSEIQHGLEKASNEYLENYIQTTALRANLLFDRVNSEVSALAGSMQTLIDQPDAQVKIGTAVANVPYFSGDLQYDSKGNWVQNGKGDPSVISIWSYLLGNDKKPRPDVLHDVQNTAIFDLVGTSLMATGSRKLQMYYIGPKDRPIMRTTPYSDQAQTFDKLYPGHNDKNFWDFFFPGVYEGWQKWIREPGSRPKEGYVTSTAPYIDAITGNLIVTFFHPLWNKERSDCAGCVAVDITLEQLSDLITNVKVADTGFGFLTMSNGNVLAITPAGEKTLGIEIQNESGGQGVTGLDRTLGKSRQPEVAALTLPTTDKISMHHISLQRDDREEPYVVVMRRLSGMNLWSNPNIGRDYATLGFVVPEGEIYATLYAAQGKIEQATARIRQWQLGILIVSLTIVLAAVFAISRRITAGISDLAEAAKRIEGKDYSVRVDIPTKDEVGELGHAFNKMTEEIESHTNNLERRVEERTQKLAAANREIQVLNDKLKVENLRMGAELDVARRMQMMVLPKPEELRSVPRLDIAGFMEPANEVGGDYYDVLQLGSRVKIGIGDVTGHGLESGVLMLMVQSVARTLLESGELDPKRFLTVLNNVICKNVARTESGNNLTLSFVDYSDNTVTLTGQHEEVIIIRKGGEVERIDTIDLGFPVGLESEISQFVQSRAIRFETGDLMILYTDGITEAESPEGSLFGIARLCESARFYREGTATDIKQGIVRDVMEHIDNQKIHDDITLLVLKHL
jgi:phosphoserine phosphatase RsbU/P